MLDNKTIPIRIKSDKRIPIVGVGSAEGSLAALQDFLRNISGNAEVCFIVCLKEDPAFLPYNEKLQAFSSFPVIELRDPSDLAPGHIYMVPFDQLLTMNGTSLVIESNPGEDTCNKIDRFFSALAEIYQEQSVGILLDGAGTDGTVGLKNIKDMGGITFAQDDSSGSNHEMTQTAIDAQVVDFILPPSEIAPYLEELLRITRHVPAGSFKYQEKDEDVFGEILTLIKAKRGIDFTHYKQTTIHRRILRRKSMKKAATLKEYLHCLMEDKSEQEALIQDILIPVTAFFRDPQVFETLRNTVFPELFKSKSDYQPIRVWVAGCSSGEEAYSMAISLHEYCTELSIDRRIQIFATDISESMIVQARSANYKRKDTAGLSEKRLKAHFTKTGGGYHINKKIREMCVFACQDFLKDPPFSRVDLVSCRNVLIYMDPFLQRKALDSFHYALNEPGYLLLGKSETAAQSSEEYVTISKQDKIYLKNAVSGKYRQVMKEKRNEEAGQVVAQNRTPLHTESFQKAADEAILTKYAPAGVVINENLEIIQFRGSTTPYLESRPGKATHDILKMAKEGLSFELRNAIHKAKTSNDTIRKENILIDGGSRHVNIEVIPLKKTLESYFLVLFEETVSSTQTIPAALNTAEKQQLTDAGERIQQLELELNQIREDMRFITEDQEAANEELQSANEELLSGSEELQSLNEELESSKEEIESSNEELSILNQELIERNDQLIYSRNYAEAIVSTIHEPFIILSKDFIIKFANRSFYDKFGVTEKQTETVNFFEWQNGFWNNPVLRNLLENIILKHQSIDSLEIKVNHKAFPDEMTLIVNARQIINENSNDKLILLAMEDITDRKKLEHSQLLFSQELQLKVAEQTAELGEINRRLRHSNESLLQFASIASHDLQEPLRKIRTFAGILLTESSRTHTNEEKKLIEKITIAADRMAILIKDVLEYSKLAGKGREFTPTNLDQLLINVLDDLDLLVQEKKATIKYNQPLPLIEAISVQIHQLLYNLIENSLKYARVELGPVITIEHHFWKKINESEMDMGRNKTLLEIVIADNGIGFEQQFAKQIFQIFERLHHADEYEGSGVGLALCKKIVDNHRGSIFANSNGSEGASFHVVIPVNQLSEDDFSYIVSREQLELNYVIAQPE